MGVPDVTAAAMVDLVITFTVAECVVLWWYHRRTGQGLPAKDFMPTLLSGMLLMLALRMHMAGWSWMVTASLLAGGGVFHALDLRRRWRPTGHQADAIKRPS